MKLMALAILGLALFVGQDDPGECCKEMSKAYYCEKCRKILPDSDCRQMDFDGDVFVACKVCAKASGDDVMAYARSRTLEIEICTRIYYECAAEGESMGCGKVRREAGECCGKPRTKRTHRSRVFYVCPECEKQWGSYPMWRIAEWNQQQAGHGNGFLQNKPGECARHNANLEPRCSLSGFFPHTPKK